MLKKSLLFLFLFFVFLFAVYLLGVSSSVYGGDSGDVILAAFFGGVAHPPGYPLNSLLGFMFTHLPISRTVAYKADVMMAMFSAGTIVFLFLTVKNLTKNIFVALSASLVLAFSPLFWLYAHVAEVFQLNVFLVSVSFYFLILWHSSVTTSKRFNLSADRLLFVSIFFLGLAVFHHQTAVLLVPAYIYLIYKKQKKLFTISKKSVKVVVFFLLGALPYIAVPFLAMRQTPVNWDDAVNIQNFVHLITRADYGSFAASSSFVGTGYMARFLQVVSFFAFVKNDFTLLGTFLIILGFIYTFLKRRDLFCFLSLAIFFSGPFFLFYSSFSLSSDFLFGVWERFILLSYLFLAIYLAYGFYFVFWITDMFIWKKVKTFVRKEVLLAVLGFSFLLLPLYMMRNNWQKTDMSNFELGDWLGHDVIASSVPGSMIFLFDDTTAFNTQYVYYIDGNYRDRKIFVGGIMRHENYREQLEREYPNVIFPSDFLKNESGDSGYYMTKLIYSNLGKVPIYTVSYTPRVEGYSWVTSGLLQMLVKNDLSTNADFVNKINEDAVKSMAINIDKADLAYGNFIPQSIKRFYGYSFDEMGDQLLNEKQYNSAIKYYLLASQIQEDDARAYLGIARSSLGKGDCSNSIVYSSKAYSLVDTDYNTLDLLSEVAKQCLHNNDLYQEYKDKSNQIRKNLFEEPIN